MVSHTNQNNCYITFSGLNIVEQSLWKAVPHYLRRVSNALKKVSFNLYSFTGRFSICGYLMFVVCVCFISRWFLLICVFYYSLVSFSLYSFTCIFYICGDLTFVIYMYIYFKHIGFCFIIFHIVSSPRTDLPAYWKASSVDLHTNKVWILDGG